MAENRRVCGVAQAANDALRTVESLQHLDPKTSTAMHNGHSMGAQFSPVASSTMLMHTMTTTTQAFMSPRRPLADELSIARRSAHQASVDVGQLQHTLDEHRIRAVLLTEENATLMTTKQQLERLVRDQYERIESLSQRLQDGVEQQKHRVLTRDGTVQTDTQSGAITSACTQTTQPATTSMHTQTQRPTAVVPVYVCEYTQTDTPPFTQSDQMAPGSTSSLDCGVQTPAHAVHCRDAAVQSHPRQLQHASAQAQPASAVAATQTGPRTYTSGHVGTAAVAAEDADIGEPYTQETVQASGPELLLLPRVHAAPGDVMSHNAVRNGDVVTSGVLRPHARNAGWLLSDAGQDARALLSRTVPHGLIGSAVGKTGPTHAPLSLADARADGIERRHTHDEHPDVLPAALLHRLWGTSDGTVEHGRDGGNESNGNNGSNVRLHSNSAVHAELVFVRSILAELEFEITAMADTLGCSTEGELVDVLRNLLQCVRVAVCESMFPQLVCFRLPTSPSLFCVRILICSPICVGASSL